MSTVVGILSLQGAFNKHAQALEKLNVNHISVKYPKDLTTCDALIIPGGESTSFSKLIYNNKLYDCLKEFASKQPVFGTCAGLILLSNISTEHVTGLGILDIKIERNGWGRQINSFNKSILLNGMTSSNFNAVFIRAPRILKLNNKDTKILSTLYDEPVLIQNKKCLGATFHPELTSDLTIHKYFIKMIDD